MLAGSVLALLLLNTDKGQGFGGFLQTLFGFFLLLDLLLDGSRAVLVGDLGSRLGGGVTFQLQSMLAGSILALLLFDTDKGQGFGGFLQTLFGSFLLLDLLLDCLRAVLVGDLGSSLGGGVTFKFKGMGAGSILALLLFDAGNGQRFSGFLDRVTDFLLGFGGLFRCLFLALQRLNLVMQGNQFILPCPGHAFLGQPQAVSCRLALGQLDNLVFQRCFFLLVGAGSSFCGLGSFVGGFFLGVGIGDKGFLGGIDAIQCGCSTFQRCILLPNLFINLALGFLGFDIGGGVVKHRLACHLSTLGGCFIGLRLL